MRTRTRRGKPPVIFFPNCVCASARTKPKKYSCMSSKKQSDFSEEYDDDMLMFRLNMTRDKRTGKRKPNVQQLAAEIAAENEAFNKSPERNGAPQRLTNQPSIENKSSGSERETLGWLRWVNLRNLPRRKNSLQNGAQHRNRASLRARPRSANSKIWTFRKKMSGTFWKKKSDLFRRMFASISPVSPRQRRETWQRTEF